MQTIGLIGGMSWESTAVYYRLINQRVVARLGPGHSAKMLLVSVDFAEFSALMHAGEWEAIGARLAELAQALERGGADFLVLATNTMHREAVAITAATRLPLLHIMDPVIAAIRARGLSRIGLIGTAFTMEQPFLADRLRAARLDVLTPPAADRAELQRIIFAELVCGTVLPASAARQAEIITGLAAAGAEGVILGCTELMLLVEGGATPLPLFDTTALHAAAAVDRALGQG